MSDPKEKKIEQKFLKSNNLSQKETKNFSTPKIVESSKVIINEELSKFLTNVSMDINRLASKSYPVQSIQRREQGTIITIVTLNAKGQLKKLDFSEKTPTRLYKATEKIIKSYKFPTPPTLILDKNGLVVIKIPVNFILR